ncbi:hypothetical protein ABGT03_16300 [Acinetobacter baumannii]|nr:hypothetical protein [Acinetobacter baumannii]ATR88514.1 hypothetical protein CTI08_14945 [Acinetobacter baumannii]PST60126.1 hypothetical protein CV950_005950 [Acinetobacter baumannii]RDF76755.1 hypothetical protein DWA07_09195 [Acinetobacter baumannii]TDI31865.1 hypothetical protein DWA06_07810 [Acinetobacter baumannii]
MIENIPDPDTFLLNSAEFMFEAIQIVQALVKDDDVPNSLDYEHLELENSIKIGTITLLVFSSIENYLKYKIAQESPFLLISNLSNIKWGKTDFDNYHMHGFEDLLKIYSVIYDTSENSKLNNRFESLRKKRNQFVHSTLDNSTLIAELFEIAAFFVENLWNQNFLHHPPLFFYFSHILDPLSEYDDVEDFMNGYAFEKDNESHAKLLTMYEILSFYLNKNSALSFLGLKKQDKRIECPVCSIYSFRKPNITDFYFAQTIIVNKVQYLYCYLCHAQVKILEDNTKNPLPKNN